MAVAEPKTEVTTYQHYIDGEWVDSANGETFDVEDPSTEDVCARVPAGSGVDAAAAIAAARRAFDRGDWRNKSQSERARILMDLAAYFEDASSDWARLESEANGATIRKTSVVDVPIAIEHFRTMAEQSQKIEWYEPLPWIDLPSVSWNFVQREPIGVCTGIVPWNFPLILTMWKLAPALAMGNAIVLKPSPLTPTTALALARAIDDSGLLPPGLVNVVTGPGIDIGEELVSNDDVDKVAFTGSTAVGREILKLAAPGIKKVTLELGGKSASIVCADADLDVAVDGTLSGVFFHQGQMCEAGTRVYVHDDVYDEFMSRLIDRAKSLKVGPASDEESQLGPVINRSQYDRILSAIDAAVGAGATLECGGGRPADAPARGYYISPTILTNVDQRSPAVCHEIFGPVLAVQRWNDLSEVIGRANQSIYGLAGGVWSRDIPNAINIAKQLRTGTVWINDWHLLNALAPFGGYRQSGIGRELGLYGLREYTETKHIHVDQNIPRDGRFIYDVLLG